MILPFVRPIPPPPEPEQPMPLWQALAVAPWWVSWSLAAAAFEAWQRAMGLKR